MTSADEFVSAAPAGGSPLAGGAEEIEHDRDTLRTVFGTFATGITVVTASGDTPMGMTANSFTSVSLSPPLALVCVERKAAIHDAILAEGVFAVSVLSSDQEHVAKYFASHSRPRGEQEFSAVDSSPGPCTGAPVLAGALAWVECRLTAVYDGGDHSIFLGSVLDLGHGTGSEALLYHGGRFHRILPHAA
ncbi:flavin reductase family protein [Streptomyces sp. V4-01]|uniref:Flavin reductase family protein n=1 Tax=Actinacidiphila polyblastidii TaxID=3110430 RepID=A0ABU7PH65_9ACTN|nr:flavin reductase family protein [Streptomyces sp. V4-01]